MDEGMWKTFIRTAARKCQIIIQQRKPRNKEGRGESVTMEANPREPRNPADHVLRNEEAWDAFARDYVEPGRRAWQGDASWGIWNILEEQVRLLPDVSGLDVIELGCGTGYVSAWLIRRGARAIGVDVSKEQLKTARAFQSEFSLSFPLIQANAEGTPFRDGSFDLAISEHGACTWCDPHAWIPEASRLLRPGGQLIFLVSGTLLMLCAPEEDDVPAGPRLLRDYFGMRRFEFSDQRRPNGESVEFHLGYGDWIRLFRANGFVVEDLVELRPPEGATTHYQYVTADWARRWPSEEVWKVRKEPIPKESTRNPLT
jgi:SAM-dependent methyltransferase